MSDNWDSSLVRKHDLTSGLDLAPDKLDKIKQKAWRQVILEDLWML